MEARDDPIAEFIQWSAGRPPVTKIFMSVSLVLAVVLSLTELTYMEMYYAWDVAIGDLQVWRLWTAFFYLGELNFSFLVEAYLAYTVLYYTERDIFGREKLANYLMLISYAWVMMLLVSSIYNLYFLADGLLFALLYVESQYKPFQQISIVFGLNIPVGYFLWVFLGFNVLMGNPLSSFVIGFLIGYSYVKIKTTLLQKLKVDLWPTPSILNRLVQVCSGWLGEGRTGLAREQEEVDEDGEERS